MFAKHKVTYNSSTTYDLCSQETISFHVIKGTCLKIRLTFAGDLLLLSLLMIIFGQIFSSGSEIVVHIDGM